ncbi:recombinase family protein [Streptomyces mutabilis]|uniref:hypothetical protein n=1 Tax=Streptomyces mutabilis TaxID=67332 RepID=UPI0022BA5E1B|nr:hypothetical protein [Streptomyces mutabilis]MCZ9355108.1 recombinase family protein [Streptomyces mutabilis]
MAETERENIRESTLEGLDTAARKGKHGGRPPVITADMLHTVLRRRAGGESVEQIQPDLIIPHRQAQGTEPLRRQHLPGARRTRQARGVPRSRRGRARRLRRPEGQGCSRPAYGGPAGAHPVPRGPPVRRGRPGRHRRMDRRRSRPAHVPRLGRAVRQPGQRGHPPHRSQRRPRTRTQRALNSCCRSDLERRASNGSLDRVIAADCGHEGRASW